MKTDLVFRTLGERTAELALGLAIEHTGPSRVWTIEGVEPFSAAVERQLRLAHDCEQVVYVDADCLVLEDMRPWLRTNRLAYVDCFVTDRFRGRVHCGVHVVRRDVVAAMASLDPPNDDPAYVLRPESRLRALALRRLGEGKAFRNFDILHDHLQHRRDLFAKYALRELRSRREPYRSLLDRSLTGTGPADLEARAARLGVAHAREALFPDAAATDVDRFLRGLRNRAPRALEEAGVPEVPPLERAELDALLATRATPPRPAGSRPKLFGIGLSRTGTRSLTMALHVLGYDTVHYPADDTTFAELSRGCYDLSVLEDHDGITDITAAPFYAQLDRHYPGSRFVLTVRDEESWLRSARRHWAGRPAFAPAGSARQETYMNVRRLLRAAVYGCYEFEPARFAWVRAQHTRNVLRYFRGRPGSLLVLDVCAGEGWEPLCRFLGEPVPRQPFPHKGRSVEQTCPEPEAAPAGLVSGTGMPPARGSAPPAPPEEVGPCPS